MRLSRYLSYPWREGAVKAVKAGRLLSAAIAVLVLILGTLTAGARLPSISQHARTRHTDKAIRYVEEARDPAETPEIETCSSIPRGALPLPKPYTPAPNLPKLTGAFPLEVLRAPPQA